ncbi:glyoxalase family protein [Chitinophaga dinghuensis]|uniref:Glyoxalase family protein n=1 Tax=Chitinophaga dinghuensis TaxID=1539050 RepID=A0A327VYV8_9BACT|nr:ring-cleaving dioxygenase [Chitinophaga dinghuensis]RAJ82251.1 glyoxalase family protein [Chitinophaga dinghuensis]
MNNNILGLHHITAIAGNAQRNLDFYTNVLGVRLVKKTVNFDDPGTYHFYFGNEQGAPGTILTFFPWEGIDQGKNGTGMATEIGYSVPTGSLDFWKDRFTRFNVPFEEVKERFGEKYLVLSDPDGLKLSLIEPAANDARMAWETAEVKKDVATKGFHSTTLTLKTIDPTAKILTDIFGYSLQGQEGNRYRFVTNTVENANIIDLIADPEGQRGYNAAGTNHHVAFRVADDKIQMEFRDKILTKGLNITPKIDRDYFYSLYFREPGGVLFEIATDNPGFTVDEPLDKLGTSLRLPKQYEPAREEIEKVLPVLK